MDWKVKIQRVFPRKGAIYLLKDHDNIFDETDMIEVLTQQTAYFMDYNDPIQFRYYYEKKYRINRVETLIIRTEDFFKVPFDIYKNAFQVNVSLDDFLDNFDYLAAKETDRPMKDLIEFDDVQKGSLSYEESQEVLNKELLSENDEKYLLFDGYDYDSFGRAAMMIGNWRAGEAVLSEEQQENIKIINSNFQSWLVSNFDQMSSLPPYPYPKMVHQIAEVMNQSDYEQKKALIVMDGMSFSQWKIINDYLKKHKIKTETHPTLAWIPSVTSVSRQSIFSGNAPFNFANTIQTTNYEERKWQEYWTSQGYQKVDLFYQRALGACDYNKTGLSNKLTEKKVIGCVIDSVDKFMHSAQQGLWSVHSELKHWLEDDFLRLFIEDLLQNQYEVYITSDHGNTEAIGVGRINQGILANSKGERVRIYDNEKIRQRTENDYSEVSDLWNSYFLPANFYPLIAKENFAFIKRGDKIVSHGGTHIEEVFVPFVKVFR